MFLVHAGRVVHVRIDLSHIVEVPMWHLLTVGSLLVFVQEVVEIKLSFQILKTSESKALAWSIGRNFQDCIQVNVKFPQIWYGDDWRIELCGLCCLIDLVDAGFI
jgi:hypothetical protein